MQACCARTRDDSVRWNTESELTWRKTRRGPRVYRSNGICRW
jgi:hypothetical protein